jgi:hypothetical protein
MSMDYNKFITVIYIDFDECEDGDSNTCHEYAHCDNAVGTYICRCFEGFFGDGNKCQGTMNSKYRKLRQM